MKKSDVKKYKIPDAPGVYMFRGTRRKLLYIGKATSLRSRVRSYFNKDIESTRGPLIEKMLDEAMGIDWQETDSVLEALILEANLIKKHQPPYNSKEKDNKSFNYLVVTKEPFPRVLVVRGRELFTTWSNRDVARVFGPFPKGGSLKAALKIVRKIFPFRDTCTPRSGSVCFNRQIGLCPGVCDGTISKQEYGKNIRNIILLFEGKKGRLLQKLQREMRVTARQEAFERAAELRNQVFALEHINDTSLIGDDFRVSRGSALERIEGYDVAHISETARVGVMVVIADTQPKKSAYRKFKITTSAKGDVAALQEIIERRLNHSEWSLPGLIVVDGSRAQIRTAEKVLREHGVPIPVVGVVKNAQHKPEKILGNTNLIKQNEDAILLANSEAHRFALAYHRKKRHSSIK